MNNYRRTADKALADYRHAAKTARAERVALREFAQRADAATQAQRIVQTVAQAVQTKVHDQIAAVVTKCFDTVFGKGVYTFRIKFTRKRGRTDAELLFVRDGFEIDPKDGDSGGVLDLASFGLRLACLLLSVPKKRRLLVLDEPFRMISRNYGPRIRELLETLSKELQIQVIQITHDPQLVAGAVVRIGEPR